MKKCPYCAEEIQDEAIVCRYCGRDLKQNIKIEPNVPIKIKPPKTNPGCIVLIIVAIAILGLVLYLYNSNSNNNGENNSGGENINLTPIVYAINFAEIIPGSTSCSSEYEYMTIKGQVRNTSSDYVLQFVEIRGTVFKDDGTTVNTDTGFIDSDILNPNATSTFSIMVSNPNDEGDKCRAVIEDARFK